MNYKFKLKKLGNHWYVDIKHDALSEIGLNEKIERCLNLIENEGELTVQLLESFTFVQDNTLLFNDDDILRYFTTNDDFEIRFTVYDHEFAISSELYYLLECRYNPNFHKYIYTIEISAGTI